MTGDCGTGKTTTIRRFVEVLDSAKSREDPKFKLPHNLRIDSKNISKALQKELKKR
ncbi:hypothetical protein [Paenibacillus tyrfis]|uniref:hypothetical protein n=1 Tax=Paenibacillus tyrfis TaxID=1501230 RepID=UPI0020A12653|nr:hypothetical protein [Paenibacillus tyrfis]MCP1312416.1 hypothetical protein [Paenibacillus tyrfis]